MRASLPVFVNVHKLSRPASRTSFKEKGFLLTKNRVDYFGVYGTKVFNKLALRADAGCDACSSLNYSWSKTCRELLSRIPAFVN